MSSISSNNFPINTQLISHGKKYASFSESYQQLEQKIRARGDLPYASVEEQIQILSSLQEFPLGSFLIENKGLNGYWTEYILRHPENGRLTNINSDGEAIGEVESFLLNKAPTVLATQERFKIFHTEIQKRIDDGKQNFVSVPCGTMDELISLDYSSSASHSLYGVDIDANTIDYVEQLLVGHSQRDNVTLIHNDAWDFKIPESVDLIVSNGLNIYVKDDQKVAELYQHFYDQIKPGGELITSFLTHPPVIFSQSEWDLSKVNQEDALHQKIIMADVLGVSWQYYRSIEQTTEQLMLAGFENIQIIPDKANIFPTVIAKKPCS